MGGKNFMKNIFSDKNRYGYSRYKDMGIHYGYSKKFWKKFFYSQKFLMTFYFVIDNFSQKLTPFIQNLLHFLCIFLYLSLFLLSFRFFLLKIKKLEILVWLLGGGQKKGFCPHLNYWEGVPGLPPESTPMSGVSSGRLNRPWPLHLCWQWSSPFRRYI